MNTQTKTPEGVKPQQLSFDEWWQLFLKGRAKLIAGKWRDSAPDDNDKNNNNNK